MQDGNSYLQYQHPYSLNITAVSDADNSSRRNPISYLFSLNAIGENWVMMGYSGNLNRLLSNIVNTLKFNSRSIQCLGISLNGIFPDGYINGITNVFIDYSRSTSVPTCLSWRLRPNKMVYIGSNLEISVQGHLSTS